MILSSGFQARYDTSLAVQPQKMTRGLKITDLGRLRDCTINLGKTKRLISCAVTTQLIRAFVFAYEKMQLFSSHSSGVCCTIVGFWYVTDGGS